MDPTYITPFIVSIQNVFSTMLNLPVQVKEPRIKTGSESGADVSSIIGMSGDVVGSVILSFPTESAPHRLAVLRRRDRGRQPRFRRRAGRTRQHGLWRRKAMFQGKSEHLVPERRARPEPHDRQAERPAHGRHPCETDCGEMLLQIAIQEAAVAANSKAA